MVPEDKPVKKMLRERMPSRISKRAKRKILTAQSWAKAERRNDARMSRRTPRIYPSRMPRQGVSSRNP